MTPCCPRHAHNLAGVGLFFWMMGLLSFEALAHMGAGLCLVAAFLGPPPWEKLKEAVYAWRWLLAFVLWTIFGPWCFGYMPKGSGVGRALLLFALPVAAYAFFLAGPRWTKRVLWGGMVLWILSCLAAALQHFGLWPSQEWFSKLQFLKSNFHRVYEEVPGQPGRYMAGGLSFHRLKFANIGSLFSLLSLGLALFATWHFSSRRRWPWLAVCFLGTLSIAWFPFARMAAFSLCLALAFQLFFGISQRKLALLCIFGLVLTSAAAITLNEGFRNRLVSSLSDEGSGNRTALWNSGWRAVKSSPLAGVGAGKFQPSAFPSDDMPAHVKAHSGKAHNQALSIAAESGLVGLFLACMAFLALAKTFLRQQHFGTPGLSILLFFACLSLTHDPLFHDVFILAFMWALGACLALSKKTSTSSSSEALHPPGPTSASWAPPP